MRTANFRWLFLIVFLAGWLTACAPKITQQLATDTVELVPAEFPESYYLQAKASGSKVLRIDTNSSLLTIVVRRDGPLARLGHDHVVSSHQVKGYIDSSNGQADLYVTLDQLAVDKFELRQFAGLTTQPSQDAINGTRRNMLDKVLESKDFPHALISVVRKPADNPNISVTITLHGTKKTYYIPAEINEQADSMQIKGQMTVNQTDFGITPFSILGGAIQVLDRLDLSFNINASK